MSKRVFYIELCNKVDHRDDDDVRRVEASSKEKAREQVDLSPHYTIGRVMTAAEFRERDPEWWWMMSRV